MCVKHAARYLSTQVVHIDVAGHSFRETHVARRVAPDSSPQIGRENKSPLVSTKKIKQPTLLYRPGIGCTSTSPFFADPRFLWLWSSISVGQVRRGTGTKILRSSSVQFLESGNLTVRFGAVFRYCKSYGAVRCCDISYGAVRCGFENMKSYGAVRCCDISYGAVRCGFQKSGILRCDRCSFQIS